MNESICSEIRKHYNLQIGTRTAKRLKVVMGRLNDQKKEARKVVGIDSISGLPREEVISAYVVNEYMERHLTDHWSLPLSLCLIIGGGIGNLIDRIFLGFVTDMIDFRFFPVFNIADIAVCVGAGFLILYTLFFSEDDASKKTKSGSREPA